MTDKPIKATVLRVIIKGLYGPYAIAKAKELKNETITFSLKPEVWQDHPNMPEKGDVVVLSDLRKKKGSGWRAMSGRFFRPADEQTDRPTQGE